MQIISAAKVVFQQYGFNKASIDDIAKQAVKSRTTLYKYYKNKDQIFEDFILLEITDIISLAIAAIGTASSLETKLHNYNAKKLELLRLKFDTYPIAAMEMMEEAALCNSCQQQLSIAEAVIMKKIFQESIDQKEINYIAPSELDFLISVITTALRGIEHEVLSSAENINIEERLKWLIGILVRGLK
ncbi:TetR/AcrR family transcriptional regulator [Pedobacter sp. L105]|uniref:TetR/AcrR family transcriptional regulator n=1 Tax=Pedobacter sp. L105 TaxID=1641871 RepID=UPI001C2060B3|nr:TetR/AcrR family transcriptional regulator [Pedobacter sp. L105]